MPHILTTNSKPENYKEISDSNLIPQYFAGEIVERAACHHSLGFGNGFCRAPPFERNAGLAISAYLGVYAYRIEV